MRTIVPYSTLSGDSWAEDLTPSLEVRQKYMYVQCMGHFYAASNYSVRYRSNIHSYLLLYTLDGVGIVEYKQKMITLSKGLSIIIDCELLHSYYPVKDNTWNFYWIHFSGTCIEGYLKEISDSCQTIDLDLYDIFHKIYEYSRENNNISNMIHASTTLIELSSRALINIKEHQHNNDHMISPVIKNILTYMEEKMTSSLTLDDICHEFSISKFYFSHLFKAQTGMTPMEYLTSLRLSDAKSLLRSTDLSIAEIAESCGYNGSSYFIHYFKMQEGMTPLSYRNQFAHDSTNE